MNNLHGGNISELAARAGCLLEELIDFSANINPLGIPAGLRSVISRNISRLSHYPAPGPTSLSQTLSKKFFVSPEQVVIGNGSTEIIYALPRALSKQRAIIPVPAYNDYEVAASLANYDIVLLPLHEEAGFVLDWHLLTAELQGNEIVFLGQPNNPTGLFLSINDIEDAARQHPNTIFILDESFVEFTSNYEVYMKDAAVLLSLKNIILLRSMTKFYAIAGLRLGYAIASREIARNLQRQIPPWSVNILAHEVGLSVLADEKYANSTRKFVSKQRFKLTREIGAIKGLRVFPGEANYLLVRLERECLDALQLERLLLQKRIAIRPCNNFRGLDARYFRIAVRTEHENTLLLNALAKALDHAPKTKKQQKKRTPAIMLQGTGSDAGKSILTAALCRIFLQDGYKVAPFKAQNMSLNSYVTRDGKEMGRAQVVQAQACKLDPDVRMNPVLLKPSSEVGSQVIVNGMPVGNMSVNEYIRYKPKALKSVHASYDELAASHDIVVLEGAGSPAEVNLRQHDIVNMQMARYADSPVLLVGDIERGGVFASFIGTMEVMTEWERNLIIGFVVNRFRGQDSLLEDAFAYMRKFTGKPVLGVVPYLKNLGLPEEDSVSFKNGLYDKPRPAAEHVEIGLIDLPYISNFTDVEPFLEEPDVYLRIIKSAADLDAATGTLGAIILPGSKNVISDLQFLYETGLAERIKKITSCGKIEVVGICGGFQMLGCFITDPFCLESDGGQQEALGLLNMRTTLAEEKTLTRQSAMHCPSRLQVSGYEIHHGESFFENKHLLQKENGGLDGAISEDGLIWGTYLHGIFDNDVFRRWFIDRLRVSRNMLPVEKVLFHYALEPAFDRLADVVRKSLAMDRIYRVLGL